MIKNLEHKMEKMQESINKDLEELKNKHTNNTSTEIKNTLPFKHFSEFCSLFYSAFGDYE